MNSYDQIKLCENKIMDSCKNKSWEYYNSRESQRTIKKRQFDSYWCARSLVVSQNAIPIVA